MKHEILKLCETFSLSVCQAAELVRGLTVLTGLGGVEGLRHCPPHLGLALLHQQLPAQLRPLRLLLQLLLLQLPPLLLLAVPVGSLILSVGL